MDGLQLALRTLHAGGQSSCGLPLRGGGEDDEVEQCLYRRLSFMQTLHCGAHVVLGIFIGRSPGIGHSINLLQHPLGMLLPLQNVLILLEECRRRHDGRVIAVTEW